MIRRYLVFITALAFSVSSSAGQFNIREICEKILQSTLNPLEGVREAKKRGLNVTALASPDTPAKYIIFVPQKELGSKTAEDLKTLFTLRGETHFGKDSWAGRFARFFRIPLVKEYFDAYDQLKLVGESLEIAQRTVSSNLVKLNHLKRMVSDSRRKMNLLNRLINFHEPQDLFEAITKCEDLDLSRENIQKRVGQIIDQYAIDHPYETFLTEKDLLELEVENVDRYINLSRNYRPTLIENIESFGIITPVMLTSLVTALALIPKTEARATFAWLAVNLSVYLIFQEVPLPQKYEFHPVKQRLFPMYFAEYRNQTKTIIQNLEEAFRANPDVAEILVALASEQIIAVTQQLLQSGYTEVNLN
jgi:hypothetical protein